MTPFNPFSQVLHIGTNCIGPGGIAAVIRMYKDANPGDFNFIPTSQGEVSKLKKLWLFLRSLPIFIFYMLFREIKVVHIHSSSHLSFYRKSLYVLLARLFGKKVILHIHGGFFVPFYQSHRSYCSRVFKLVDRVLTVSDYLREQLKPMLPQGIALQTCYNPIPEPNLRTGSCVPDSPDKIQVLFFGTMNENKGIMNILDCLAANRDTLANQVEVHLCGVGPLQRIVDQRVQDSLSDFTTYHGWVTGPQKQELLRQAQIYLQPSEFESLGIGIMEAMSYGSAIVASNRGGIPELVKNDVNGILIPSQSSEAIYQALVLLAKDNERRIRYGNNSKKLAERFYLPQIMLQLKEIYSSLIEGALISGTH